MDGPKHFFVAVEFSTEQIGHGLAGAVVVGGAKAAGRHDHVGAIQGVLERGMHFVRRIADYSFVHHAQADLVQLRCEEKGIGVQAKRSEEFGTDRDDLSLHALRVLLDEAEGAQATREFGGGLVREPGRREVNF